MFTMYMVTHKTIDFIPKGRIPFFVGQGSNSRNYISDSTGDNISHKNKFFCELTAYYWIWKNDKTSDYVSIEHYRRFFMKKNSIVPLISKKNELQKVVESGKIITSRYHKMGMSIEEFYRQRHDASDLLEVRRIIEDRYSEYMPAFNKVMTGNQSPLLNMVVMKKEIFDRYCSWLFDVLFEAERNISLEGRTAYQQRAFGFLAERLLEVWIQTQGYDTYRVPIYRYEENIIKSMLKSAKGRIPKIYIPKGPKK